MVELYGGFKDFEKKIPYTRDTLQLVYSTSKNMEAVAVARLVEQGYLKYEDKIASIWPDFGAKNKEDVTVEDLLRHEGGVAYFSDPQATFKHLIDDEKRYKLLIDQPHLWEGKKVRCYHAMTQGWYLNEIVRRVHPQKRTLGEIYSKEINPLRMLSFTLDYQKRTCLAGQPGSPLSKSSRIRNGENDFENGEVIHRSENPSFNGFTNALLPAKVTSCLANKGRIEDSVLISEAGLTNAISDCIEEFDTCLFTKTCFSRGGFGVFTFPALGDVKFYGWPGMGGSFTLFNPEYNFAIAYVMNGAELSILTEGRAEGLIVAAFKAHMKLPCDKQ
ncbi:hypothetical protein DSO57_1032783 [Entomophthora muscae]|uniref:Uncharacterized protein n=1 Tax=Entomophthora muscae TaxID=34485 RepID=A0ACC2RF08_9FUNG|nr:hypothetical protein DSO57_1032783 [Entomophthora muscae]